jgi:hypothetical protein
LTIKATSAVLKTNEMPCAVAVRRMVLSVMPTSETCAVSMVCAIVAVARKLAGILHRIWVSEADFPRRLRRQGHATTAIEACAVVVARMTGK